MFLLGMGAGMVTASVIMGIRLLSETKADPKQVTVDLNTYTGTDEEKLIQMLRNEFPSEDWSALDKFKK